MGISDKKFMQSTMASRQLIRRLSPLFRNARLLTPVSAALRVPRHTVLHQNLAARLTGARCMSTNAESLDIINIQDEDDFQSRVVNSEKPVVVDFHATWCGPCKLLGPRLEAIIGAEKGKVVMAKVDIDENVELAMKYNVQSVPTVYGVKNGRVVKTFIGLKDDDELKSFVKAIM